MPVEASAPQKEVTLYVNVTPVLVVTLASSCALDRYLLIKYALDMENVTRIQSIHLSLRCVLNAIQGTSGQIALSNAQTSIQKVDHAVGKENALRPMVLPRVHAMKASLVMGVNMIVHEIGRDVLVLLKGVVRYMEIERGVNVMKDFSDTIVIYSALDT